VAAGSGSAAASSEQLATVTSVAAARSGGRLAKTMDKKME
jgi:hypothetical protein